MADIHKSCWFCRLFEIVWSRRLGHLAERWGPRRVLRVTGWRSALVEYEGGQRYNVEFIFWYPATAVNAEDDDG